MHVSAKSGSVHTYFPIFSVVLTLFHAGAFQLLHCNCAYGFFVWGFSSLLAVIMCVLGKASVRYEVGQRKEGAKDGQDR